MADLETTWDGLPVAREPPYASCVVVWRRAASGREFLVLHRLAPGGAAYEGDWAWTPPSGARQPGETPEDAARRELREETGLELPLAAVPSPSADVALYAAEAPSDARVVLDAEHDRFRWSTEQEAVAACLPEVVASYVAAAARELDRIAKQPAWAEMISRLETRTPTNLSEATVEAIRRARDA